MALKLLGHIDNLSEKSKHCYMQLAVDTLYCLNKY